MLPLAAEPMPKIQSPTAAEFLILGLQVARVQ
jgi:hypothetical protein